MLASVVAAFIAAPLHAASESAGFFSCAKFGIRLAPGYAIGMDGMNVDRDGNGGYVYLADGEGLNCQGELFLDLGKNFEIGLETGYWRTSKKTSFGDWSSSSQNLNNLGEIDSSGYQNYSSTWTGSVIPARLWLRAFLPVRMLRVFAGASIGAYLPSSFQDTYSYDIYSSSTINGATSRENNHYDGTISYRFKTTVGFAGEIGVDVPLGAHFGFLLRTQMNLVNFWPSKLVTHYTKTETGPGLFPYTSQTSTYDSTTNYVDSLPYSSPCKSSSTTNGNTQTTTIDCSPSSVAVKTTTVNSDPSVAPSHTETLTSQALQGDPVPGSNISFQGGVYYRF